MAGILVAAHRVLKKTGTLWLHHDNTMGAYLRVLGDMVFGPRDALGTLIWRRTVGPKNTKRSFARNHDTIAVWGRWRLWRCASDLTFGDPALGERVYVDGVCDERLGSVDRERIDYPTQKPVALISRFIRAATVPGDLVCDPTCGSGTTLVAALALGRRAVGIDASADAIAAARARLPKPDPTPAPRPVIAAPSKRAPTRQLDLFGEAA